MQTPRHAYLFVALVLGWLLVPVPPGSIVIGMPVQDSISLVEAVRSGNLDVVRALLEAGADPNQTAPDKSTPLLWASYLDDPVAVELLIDAGARMALSNDLGTTPLWAASQNGSDAVVRQLIAAGADPNQGLLSGETPLMVAARSGYADVVRLLIASGANVDARGTRDQTALMWAAAQKHPDVVRALLAGGAEVDQRSEVWSQIMAVPPHGFRDYNREVPHGGNTALMFAVRAGDLESAELMVAGGADVDAPDAWGVTSVMMAAHAGYADMVGILLGAGADPNASGPGFTALHAAIMRRDLAMVETLLSHGADPGARLETWTPTRRSSDDHHFTPELVGADPFWLASRFGGPSIMRALLDAGADPLFVHRGSHIVASITGDGLDERTNETTALMAVLGMGGGRPWVRPDSGEAPALTLDAVRLLLDLGVDPNAKNTDGRTALDAAENSGYDDVVALLLGHGARPGDTRRERVRR